MSTSRSIFLAMVASFLLASAAMAQQKRISPPDIAGGVIDGDRVTIYYSRPYTKDPKTGEPRKIWGGLVPYGKVWRTGANEATLLVIQKPIAFGDTVVPAGAYTLWTLPSEDGAKLIINKQIGQWGEDNRNPKNVYDEANDVCRVDMKKEDAPKPVDQFTIQVARNPDGGGIIKMMWENTMYSAPFKVQK